MTSIKPDDCLYVLGEMSQGIEPCFQGEYRCGTRLPGGRNPYGEVVLGTTVALEPQEYLQFLEHFRMLNRQPPYTAEERVEILRTLEAEGAKRG